MRAGVLQVGKEVNTNDTKKQYNIMRNVGVSDLQHKLMSNQCLHNSLKFFSMKNKFRLCLNLTSHTLKSYSDRSKYL
jgi:hypothetical protein